MSTPSARLGTVQPIRPVDGALAAVTAAVAVAGAVAEIAEATRPVPPPVGGVGIAAAAGALVLLGRSPAIATGGVLVLTLVYHLLGYPGLAPAVALFVTLYVLAAAGRGPRTLIGAAAAILAVSLIPLLPPSPTGLGWPVLGPAIGYVAVVALGEAARSHRVATEARMDAVRREAELEARGRLLEERVELAREVHDVLAHTVTVIAVQAAAAEDALDRRPAETRAALATMRVTAREALAELRGAVALLRGGVEPVPESPGIAGLARLCEQAGSAGTAVTLTAPGATSAGALPGVVDRAVYRIVQEALTNTVRHAAAGSASVLIDLGRGEVRVEIVDDGVGAQCVVEGHGLRGMRERAQALGGTLDAGPAPGRGFRVTARLPVGARS
jgi:signal transduction histidine kinase